MRCHCISALNASMPLTLSGLVAGTLPCISVGPPNFSAPVVMSSACIRKTIASGLESLGDDIARIVF